MILKKSYISQLINVIICFMYFFDIAFLSLSTLFSTRKIVFLFLVVEAIFKKIVVDKEDIKRTRVLLLGNILILFYLFFISFINSTFTNEYSSISRYIYFILYTIIGSILLINHYNTEYDFMNRVIGAMWIQSVIVFLEAFSMSFRNLLANTFVATGNVTYEATTTRATGLGAEASYLTLLLFIGIFCCNYYMITKTITLYYIISQVVFLGAIFLVGRTGLYFSVVIILITVLWLLIKSKKLIGAMKILTITIGLVFIGLNIIKAYMGEVQYEKLIGKVIYAMQNFSTDDSVQTFSSFPIPELNAETFIGTGIFRGYTNSGLYLWNDSGYIQMYSSLGLLFAIFFYTLLYVILIQYINTVSEKKNKTYFILYFLAVIIAEVKEPYIFRYILPLFLIVSISLYNRRKLYEKNGFN